MELKVGIKIKRPSWDTTQYCEVVWLGKRICVLVDDRGYESSMFISDLGYLLPYEEPAPKLDPELESQFVCDYGDFCEIVKNGQFYVKINCGGNVCGTYTWKEIRNLKPATKPGEWPCWRQP